MEDARAVRGIVRKTPTYERLSDAGNALGQRIVDAHAARVRGLDVGNVYGDYDGGKAFVDMRDILYMINGFGGMVTVQAQSTTLLHNPEVPEWELYQRPYISLLAHKSMAPLFTALAMEECIAVYSTDETLKLQPVTFSIQPRLGHWDRLYTTPRGNSVHNHVHLEQVTGKSIVPTWARIVTENIGRRVFMPADPDEMIGVVILWTRTSRVDKFISILEKYFRQSSDVVILPQDGRP